MKMMGCHDLHYIRMVDMCIATYYGTFDQREKEERKNIDIDHCCLLNHSKHNYFSLFNVHSSHTIPSWTVYNVII